jgi:hypothetical protein
MKTLDNVRGINLVDIDGKLVDSIALLKHEQPVLVATIDGKGVSMISGASDKDLFVFAVAIVDALVERTDKAIPDICSDIATHLLVNKMAKEGTYNPFDDLKKFLGL